MVLRGLVARSLNGSEAITMMTQGVRRALLSCASVSCAYAFFPLAGAYADDSGSPSSASSPPSYLPSPSIATTFPALADPGGVRSALAAKGVQFQLNYIGEVLGNVSGGERTGAIAEQQFNLIIDADLEKMFGWQGAAVHANGYWIAGTGGLSRDYIGNLLTASGIEALPSVRLYEAWFEQKLAGGKIAIRAGQLGADTEFLVSKYAGLFVNSTFGWPEVTAADLPSGGPAYPLATPAVRLKLTPSDQFAVLLGLFDGNPAGPCSVNPQICDPNGVNFRLQDPPLFIGEGQYSYSLNMATGLDGTVKLGGWEHFGEFNGLLFDTAGVPLAGPASNGMPQQFSGDDGIYGVIDQMIYHPANSDPGNGIGVFARISGSPPDRNLIDFYADGGINFTGMIPGRPSDSFGAAAAYAHISHDQSLDEQEFDADSGVPAPVQNYEAALELTYDYQVIPGFTIQPDLQYVIHPGGNIANPDGTGLAPIPNAFIIGVRATINY
jgi:porin